MESGPNLSRPQYRQFVSLVAHRHGCRLVDIDFSGGSIYLTGADQAVRSCGRELKKLLGFARQRAAGKGKKMAGIDC